MITLLFMAGCGGNSDNGSGASTTRVTLATQGTLPAGKALSGIDVTLQLPTGVTPAVTANGAVDINVVKTSGVLVNNASLFTITYYPASDTEPGTLNFVIYSTDADGFGIGEFAVVTLNKAARAVDFATVSQNISAGTTPLVTTDYRVTSSSPRDLAGDEVNSVNVTLTVEPI